MSIIGTRPPLISETNLYELHHRARLAIKPGITGMWQVSGRSDITDFEEVVRLDKEYIENWNIGLDIGAFVIWGFCFLFNRKYAPIACLLFIISDYWFGISASFTTATKFMILLTFVFSVGRYVSKSLLLKYWPLIVLFCIQIYVVYQNRGGEYTTSAFFTSFLAIALGFSAFLIPWNERNRYIGLTDNSKIGDHCVLSYIEVSDREIPDNVVLHGLKQRDGSFCKAVGLSLGAQQEGRCRKQQYADRTDFQQH